MNNLKQNLKTTNRIWFVLFFYITLNLVSPNLFAQDEDKPELSIFRGGTATLDFNINFGFLGQGAGSAMMGGVVSSRAGNGAASMSFNPAMLGSVKKRQILVSGNVGYGTFSSSMFRDELISTLNDEIDGTSRDAIEDPENFILTPNAVTQYTKFNDLNAGIPSRLQGISVAWPIHNRITLGFANHTPSVMDMRLQATGISTKIAQEQGTEDVSLRFDVLMNINLLAETSFRMNKSTVGVGGTLYEGKYGTARLGASTHFYQMTNSRILDADLSGMVVVGSADERFFNNPDDVNLNPLAGDTNEFLLQARGNFKDNATGFQIGATYELPKILTLNLVYEQAPSFQLRDINAQSSAYLPVFLVGDDVLSGDLTVELDTLQANKPNLTSVRNVSELVSTMDINMPSSFTAGLDLYLKRHTLVLNFTKYTDDLSLRYGGSTYGKSADLGAGFGMDFQFSDKLRGRSLLLMPVRFLFLDFDGILMQIFRNKTGYEDPHYMFGGKVLLGDGFVSGNANQDFVDNMGMPLPLGFSFGRRYTIFDGVTVGMTVMGFPDLLFRYSVGFNF